MTKKSILFFLFCFSLLAGAESTVSGIKALASIKSYGAVGDGVTDDTLAIQRALDGSTKLLFPPGRYKTSHSLYPRSNTELISDHAVIYYTKEYGVARVWPAIFFKKNIHHVRMLGHWVLEGDSPHSAFKRESAGPDNSYVEGLKIKTGCSDIYIESLEGFHFTAGVMEIGADIPSNESSRDIRVDKFKAYNCWNAALAITSGSDIHFGEIETFGVVSNPNYAQIGFDIEVNSDGDTLHDIRIDKIVTHDNETGFQVLAKSRKQGGITINEIISFNNRDNGIGLLDANDIHIKHAQSYDNGGAGLFLEESFSNISIDKGSLHDNRNHGVLAQMDGYGAIPASSENLQLGVDIYGNHGYGILLNGTDLYPVKKFIFSGNVYNRQNEKVQLTGIDVRKNVHDINISGEVYHNTFYQIRR